MGSYEAVTQEIRIRVTPAFAPERSDPASGRYFWIYTVEIANEGPVPVVLRSRYWRITDGHGQVHEVSGPGVVGEQPRIEPGGAFDYTSGCPLATPSGIMVGSYTMQLGNGDCFEAAIPAFSLDLPGERRVLN